MIKYTCVISVMLSLALCWAGTAEAKRQKQTDDEVRQRIIDDAIAAYPGVCACPFNIARNGSRCGGRSAWSRQGGYALVCFKKEVSKESVEEWRRNNDA